MGHLKATEGRIVRFTPSDRTADKFKNKKKKSYSAIVTDVNKDSIDLTVFGVGEIVFASNAKHASEAEEGRSSWDWPQTNAPQSGPLNG